MCSIHRQFLPVLTRLVCNVACSGWVHSLAGCIEMLYLYVSFIYVWTKSKNLASVCNHWYVWFCVRMFTSPCIHSNAIMHVAYRWNYLLQPSHLYRLSLTSISEYISARRSRARELEEINCARGSALWVAPSKKLRKPGQMYANVRGAVVGQI